jgi:hypothetical protein
VPAVIRRAAAGVDRITASWPLLNQLGDHTLTRWVKSRRLREIASARPGVTHG